MNLAVALPSCLLKFPIAGFPPIHRDCNDKGHDLCIGGQNKSPIDNHFVFVHHAGNMT